MSLPKGGFNNPPPTEKIKTCRLGKVCADDWRGKKCKTHQWTNKHDELYPLLIGVTLLGIAIFVSFGAYMIYHENVIHPIREMLNGYNCNQLAEYVADMSNSWTYAEHRYEWLCVNEQVKEFRG